MTTAESPIRVLHLLYSSLPAVAGYTIRSSYMLSSLRAQGIDAVAATVPEFGEHGGTEVIDGVTYHRWSNQALGPRWTWVRRVPVYRNRYRADREVDYYADLAKRVGAQVIHSHSAARCGMIGGRVAAALGLPYIYEVRGLWDESAIAEGKLVEGSVEHDRRRRLELRAVRAADRVIAISEALRDHLVSVMGADPLRCVVVPNGVDSERFRPWAGENPLRADARLGAGPVLGYVGSLRHMEGLELAIRAMTRLGVRFPDARLAVVGEGPQREVLTRLATELGVAERVVIPGGVPHAEVLAWYDRIDLFIVPRLDLRVTQLVTPLKPLEAMAAGRPILVSNVGGLQDLTRPPGCAYVFRAGDEGDFVEQASAALSDADGRRATGERARQWVQAERGWGAVAARYLPVYAELVANPPRQTDTRRRRLDPTPPPGRWVAVWSLLVGAAVLALSRTVEHGATPYVQGLLLSLAFIHATSHWMSRRAQEGNLFRAAADTFFDIGFAMSLLGLAAWTHRTRMPVERLPLTLASIGALCLFSASQVGFVFIGKAEHPAFWTTVRAVLALGTAALATVRMDFWPLSFVLVGSTAAWTLHAVMTWHGSPAATVHSTMPTDPEARIAKLRDNIVDRLLYRPISRRISLPLARTGLSPDLVTVVGLILGGLAALAMASQDTALSVWGAVLLQLSFVADCVDGEVARAQGRSSPFGAWFDWISDRFVVFVAVFGLAMGARYETRHQTAVIWASVLALVACEIFPRTFRDKTSFLGTLTRAHVQGPGRGIVQAFHRWRERRGLGMSMGPGALILVVGLGAAVGMKFETLILLMVVRGAALLYKLTRIVRELE